MRKLLGAFVAASIFLYAGYVSAAIHPVKIFSDHMVLQRELPAPIWGKGDVGKVVTVQFADQLVKTMADPTGHWKVWLKPMEANSAGRELKIISGEETVLIRDVLVGEVWFSGGQSNMGYTVRVWRDACARVKRWLTQRTSTAFVTAR